MQHILVSNLCAEHPPVRPLVKSFTVNLKCYSLYVKVKEFFQHYQINTTCYYGYIIMYYCFKPVNTSNLC